MLGCGLHCTLCRVLGQHGCVDLLPVSLGMWFLAHLHQQEAVWTSRGWSGSCCPTNPAPEEPWVVGNKPSLQREHMMPFCCKTMTGPPGRCGFAMQFHILTQAVLSPKYMCSIRTKLLLSFFWHIQKFYCWPTAGIIVLFAASEGSAGARSGVSETSSEF